MIDIGASATVCGLSWYRNWIGEGEQVKLEKSEKQFRFGDGRLAKSLGPITLFVSVPSENGGNVCLKLYTDVVTGSVPLLVSYGSLHRAKCILNFSPNELLMGENAIKLKATPRGHLYLPMIPFRENKEDRDDETLQQTERNHEVYPAELAEMNPAKLKTTTFAFGTCIFEHYDAGVTAGKSIS